MLEKLDNAIVCNGHVDLDDIGSDIIIFFGNEMNLNPLNFNNINLDDKNFDEDDAESVIHVRLMAWSNIYKQHQGI